MDQNIDFINENPKPWYARKEVIVTISSLLILFLVATGAGAYLLLQDRNKKQNNSVQATPTVTITESGEVTGTVSIVPTNVTYNRQKLTFDGGDVANSYVISLEIPSNGVVKTFQDIPRPQVGVQYLQYEIEISSHREKFSLYLGSILETAPQGLSEVKKIEGSNVDSLYRVREKDSMTWKYSTNVTTSTRGCYNGIEDVTFQSPCGSIGVFKIQNDRNLYFLDIICTSEVQESLEVCDHIIASIRPE